MRCQRNVRTMAGNPRLKGTDDPTALSALDNLIAADLLNQSAVEHRASSRETSNVEATLDHAGVRARANLPLDLRELATRTLNPFTRRQPKERPGPALREKLDHADRGSCKFRRTRH
jgi:hypothetical protein